MTEKNDFWFIASLAAYDEQEGLFNHTVSPLFHVVADSYPQARSMATRAAFQYVTTIWPSPRYSFHSVALSSLTVEGKKKASTSP